MWQVAVVPFDETMLPAAGELLAARHRAHRAALPALPERFAEPAVAQCAVKAVWREMHAGGVAALLDGRLIGYMIGAWRADESRGRTAWVSRAGHAIAPTVDAEIYRDLYATL